MSAITILELAKFRGLVSRDHESDSYSMGDFDRVGLPMLGGCQRCEACIAAYNAAPSKTGYLMCASGCIGDDGYETAQEANMALFPEEYAWQGVKASKPSEAELEGDNNDSNE